MGSIGGAGCVPRQASRPQVMSHTVMPIHLCQAYHCSFSRPKGSPTMDRPSVNPATISPAVSQCRAIAVAL